MDVTWSGSNAEREFVGSTLDCISFEETLSKIESGFTVCFILKESPLPNVYKLSEFRVSALCRDVTT